MLRTNILFKPFIKIIACAVTLTTIFAVTEALAGDEEWNSLTNQVQSGQYPEALQAINIAAERNDENYIFPVILGLSWVEVAKYYQPARTSLDVYRNRYTSSLASGKFDEYKLHVILEMNKSLGENYRSVELLREIDAASPHRDGSLFDDVEMILVDGGAYQLGRRYMGKNPEQIFVLRMMSAKSMRKVGAEQGRSDYVLRSIKRDIEKMVGIITILENTGDNKLARKLEDRLIKEWDGPEATEVLAARKSTPATSVE